MNLPNMIEAKKSDEKSLNDALGAALELIESSHNPVILADVMVKRFCAKEAFSKAIGIGIGRGIDMRDIIIKKDSLGKPSILLTDKGYTFIEKYYEKERTLIQFNISITDEPPYVNSFVIINLNHE